MRRNDLMVEHQDHNNTIMLDKLPPPVLQTRAHPARSERYVHINTHDVIKALESEGFGVASVQVTRSKNKDLLYARHQVDLRHRELKTQDGYAPRFLFNNSHDGSSSAHILTGVIVWACSNGLVVGDVYAKERVRHSGDAAADIIEKARNLARNTQPLFDTIERWKKKQLTGPQAREFARLASVLRWNDPHRFNVDEVMKVRREADDAGSLWSTFQRVQENCVRGGLVGLSASGRRATSRPLSDIINSNDFNAQLWKLAEEFAKL